MSGNLPPNFDPVKAGVEDRERDKEDYCHTCDSAPCRCDAEYEAHKMKKIEEKM